MAQSVRSTLDFNSEARIINLLAPVANEEPVRLADLNAALEGKRWKDPADVATTTNLSIAAPGGTIDGVTMVSGMRLLVKDQSTNTENGIYVWNGPATTLTRAVDASVGTELVGAVIEVLQGTSNVATTWRQTNGGPITIGSTAVTWSSVGTSVPDASTTVAGKIEIATQGEVDAGVSTILAVTPATLAASSFSVKRYIGTITGDGTTSSFVVTHNLNSQDVDVTVRENFGSRRKIWVEDQATSATQITIVFAVAPSNGVVYKVRVSY